MMFFEISTTMQCVETFYWNHKKKYIIVLKTQYDGPPPNY